MNSMGRHRLCQIHYRCPHLDGQALLIEQIQQFDSIDDLNYYYHHSMIACQALTIVHVCSIPKDDRIGVIGISSKLHTCLCSRCALRELPLRDPSVWDDVVL